MKMLWKIDNGKKTSYKTRNHVHDYQNWDPAANKCMTYLKSTKEKSENRKNKIIAKS